MAVVVPAADEEQTIGACLASVLRAVADLVTARPGVSADVVVALDGCRDRTAAVVADVGGVHAVVLDARNVGRARGLGSRTALCRAPVPPSGVWTAHTDADSTVPPGWLLAHLRAAEAGADVVLGTVDPGLTADGLAAWQRFYRDEDGHPHVHGTNLGVRGDVLRRLGGWPPLAGDEDVALVTRAAARGLRIDPIGGVAVTTSARRHGRAVDGFAGFLRDLGVGDTA